MQLGYMTEVRIEFVQLSPSVQKTLTRARIDDPADARYCQLSGALTHSATGTTYFGQNVSQTPASAKVRDFDVFFAETTCLTKITRIFEFTIVSLD